MGLGLIASALGLLPWPRPDWSPSSTWMIDEVPGLLWIFVSSATLVCTSTATVLTLRGIGLRGRDWLTWAWLGVAWLTAAALTWNALYAAALSTIEFGTPIPVFDWLFTFIPGLVAGSLFLRRGRMARQAAALCTGVVTVPLYALSWALLALEPESWLLALAGTVLVTLFFAVIPLVAAVLLVGILGKAAPAGQHRKSG